MKKILFIFTNTRVAEKIIPVIPLLAHEAELYGIMIGEFSLETPWPGDVDERQRFIDTYQHYFKDLRTGPGVRAHGASLNNSLAHWLDELEQMDLVILDDNREMPEYQLPMLYERCKALGIRVIGNSHGNQDLNSMLRHLGAKKSFDSLFVFGDREQKLLKPMDIDAYAAGIPANDKLKDLLHRRGQYMLVITNFLGNRYSPFMMNFDEKWRDAILKIAPKGDVVIKQKTRLDDPMLQRNIEYIKNLLPKAKVISNTDDLDGIVADAAMVISADSTLAFKSIQLGKPTVIINGSGQVGNLGEWPYRCDIDGDIEGLLKQQIINDEPMLREQNPRLEFLDKVMTGASDFTACEKYVEQIKKFL